MNSEAANLIQSLCMLAKSQQGLNLEQQGCLHRGAVQPDCLVSMPLCLPAHHATHQQVMSCVEQLYAVVVPGQRSCVVGSASGFLQQVVTFTLQISGVRAYHHMQWRGIEDTEWRSGCAGLASMLQLHIVVWVVRRRGDGVAHASHPLLRGTACPASGCF